MSVNAISTSIFITIQSFYFYRSGLQDGMFSEYYQIPITRDPVIEEWIQRSESAWEEGVMDTMKGVCC